MTSPVGVNAPMGVSLTKDALMNQSKKNANIAREPGYNTPSTGTKVRFNHDMKAAGTEKTEMLHLPLKSILKTPTGSSITTVGDVLTESGLQMSHNFMATGVTTSPTSPFDQDANLNCKESAGVNDCPTAELTDADMSPAQPSSVFTSKNRPHLTLDLSQVVPSPVIFTRSPSVPRGSQLNSPEEFYSPISSPEYFQQPTTPDYAKVRHFAQSPAQQFRHLPLSRNPFMSPYLADIELLAGIPPVYFIVSIFKLWALSSWSHYFFVINISFTWSQFSYQKRPQQIPFCCNSPNCIYHSLVHKPVHVVSMCGNHASCINLKPDSIQRWSQDTAVSSNAFAKSKVHVHRFTRVETFSLKREVVC